jgi:hypothetical protein
MIAGVSSQWPTCTATSNGKAKRTTLDLDKNAAITDKVREYCLSNPTAKFVEAFETESK